MRGRFLVLTAIVAALPLLGDATVLADHGSKRRARARLSGDNEVPAVSSTGRGSFEARIDKDTETIEFELSYQDLEGTTIVAAHVHFGQKDVNGGVMFFLCGGGSKPACPPSPATITGTVVAADIVGPAGQGIDAGEFAEAVAAIRDGLAYTTVHTDKHPGGEIRGQLR
jgi:hypothetical protein